MNQLNAHRHLDLSRRECIIHDMAHKVAKCVADQCIRVAPVPFCVRDVVDEVPNQDMYARTVICGAFQNSKNTHLSVGVAMAGQDDKAL